MSQSPFEPEPPQDEEGADPVEAREQEQLAAMADADAGAPLRLRLSEQQGIPVLALIGELDLYTSEQFQHRLAELIARKPAGIVIDLSRTVYIDSSGLGILLRASRALPGGVAVVAPAMRIQRLFKATGLAAYLKVHPSLPAAINALL